MEIYSELSTIDFVPMTHIFVNIFSCLFTLSLLDLPTQRGSCLERIIENLCILLYKNDEENSAAAIAPFFAEL